MHEDKTITRRKWDLSTILDLPKAKSRIQALSPRNLRKNNMIIYLSLLVFNGKASKK